MSATEGFCDVRTELADLNKEAAELSVMNYKRHVLPLLERGWIEMTIPDKPQSRLQKYRLTSVGEKELKKRGGRDGR